MCTSSTLTSPTFGELLTYCIGTAQQCSRPEWKTSNCCQLGDSKTRCGHLDSRLEFRIASGRRSWNKHTTACSRGCNNQGLNVTAEALPVNLLPTAAIQQRHLAPTKHTMAVVAIFTYEIASGRLGDFLAKLQRAGSAEFTSPVMPSGFRMFRSTVPGPDTGPLLVFIEYPDMAAYGARTAWEQANPTCANSSPCARIRPSGWSRSSCSPSSSRAELGIPATTVGPPPTANPAASVRPRRALRSLSPRGAPGR